MAGPAYRSIRIVCPALARTGGPEALHQLGRALLDRGHDAAMVYIADDIDTWISFRDGVAEAPALADLMAPEYAVYGVPRATAIADADDVGVVIPEIWPRLASRFTRATVHLWWLSIDNGLERLREAGGLAALGPRCLHLAQSHYAQTWLAARGVRARMLSDYITPAMTATAAERAEPREARILYPARGREFAETLRARAPELAWREIGGLTPEALRALFLASRLYVDFGNHPGKDRMPREAAMLGCCIVTGRRGAAGNRVDIPIPNRYKFRETRFAIPAVLRTLRRLLREHEARAGDFAAYRAAIAGERETFAREVASVFGQALAR